MHLSITRTLPMITCLLSFACHPATRGSISPNSGLSSITIGNFVPTEGMSAWKMGKLAIVDSAGGKPAIEKTFSEAESKNGTGGSADMKVPYGDYIVSLQYFADTEAKSLLYKSCLDEKEKEIVHSVKSEKVSLKIEVCSVKGDRSAGSTTGDKKADVSIEPVIRGQAPKDPQAPKAPKAPKDPKDPQPPREPQVPTPPQDQKSKDAEPKSK